MARAPIARCLTTLLVFSILLIQPPLPYGPASAAPAAGMTERVSVSSSGEQGHGTSNYPSISADGRFVAFESWAANLVSGDTNGRTDIFVHDRCPGGNCPIYGQGSISGRVTTADGTPLPGVIITTRAGYQAVTGADGVYTLADVPGGTYMLRPSLAGYSFYPEWLIAPAGAMPFSTSAYIAAGEQAQDFTGVADGGPVKPFLHLPIKVDGMTFLDITRDTWDKNKAGKPGKINSWFDHMYPGENRLTSTTGVWTYHLIDDDPADRRIENGLACYKRLCYEGHDGYDFVGDSDKPPIYAAAPGKVVAAGWDNTGFGQRVVIDHHEQGYLTLYGHLAHMDVQEGVEVIKGQQIGVMGNTGFSTGSDGIHLHFGIYRDVNGNGRLDYGIDKQVDPFGWDSPERNGVKQDDPWVKEGGVVSRYLWVENQPPVTNERELTSNSGTVTAINNMEGEGFWSIVEGIVTGIFSHLHRIVSHSFRIDLLEWRWPGGNIYFLHAEAQAEGFQFTVRYQEEEMRHLDESQLVLYQVDESGELRPLPSQVDAEANTVTASAASPGEYSLQAPLLCPSDQYEVNDWPAAAREIDPAISSAQALFDIPEDEDWYVFQATPGTRYTIQAKGLADGVRLSLQLYDADQTTLLAETTGTASLTWQAGDAGSYYLRAAASPDGASGCDATYSLNLTVEGSRLFLPYLGR